VSETSKLKPQEVGSSLSLGTFKQGQDANEAGMLKKRWREASIAWMDGWMDGWMDEGMNGWMMKGWMDGQRDGWMAEWMIIHSLIDLEVIHDINRLDKWIDRQIDRQI
jgi:hypothetical protein